jgi:enhancing lycopene biosynthesis protein 2
VATYDILFGDLADTHEILAILGARHVGMPLEMAVEAEMHQTRRTLELRMRRCGEIGNAWCFAT